MKYDVSNVAIKEGIKMREKYINRSVGNRGFK